MSHSDESQIHFLWIDGELSALEHLALAAATTHCQFVNLWSYDRAAMRTPPGVRMRDANEVLDRTSVFRYRHVNQFGHGQGSYAGFSDIFRCKVLFDHGGWWLDIDVTLLRPLDLSAPYVFRSHDLVPAGSSLMKAPKGCELMRRVYQATLAQINADNCDWMLPINLFNTAIADLGLRQFIVPGLVNDDLWEQVSTFARSSPAIPPSWYAIHWMNEEWRTRQIDKNSFICPSILATLVKHYGIEADLTALCTQELGA